LLGLTVVTGIVDAVSILSLGRVFVANMTGNVVFIGFALARAPGFSLSASLSALVGFCSRLARRPADPGDRRPAPPLRYDGCGWLGRHRLMGRLCRSPLDRRGDRAGSPWPARSGSASTWPTLSPERTRRPMR
jgi:hypothetical protein